MARMMKDCNKTKQQLISELAEMRRRIESLEAEKLNAEEVGRTLLESEKKFRTLAEATDAIIYLAREQNCLYINPAAEKITGYSVEELRQAKDFISLFIHPDHYETIRKAADEALRDKKEMRLQGAQKIVTKTGEERWLDVAANFIEYKGQSALIGTAFDVTYRKRAEEQVRLQERQLLQAEKMATLGILVSGVAHEINNPLNYILLNAKIALRVWNEAAPILQEYFETKGDFYIVGMRYSLARTKIGPLISGISEGAARIEKIVTGLRNYSRQDPGALNQSIAINSVVESALVIVNDLIKRSTNFFSAEYGEGLPAILGNYQQLEQVIINLITNACHALSNKKQRIRLSTGWNPKEKHVRIVIADEGEGIAPEHLKHVLDPFFTTKRHLGGTGLGLPISQKIVQKHGGELRLTSEPGKGTTAELTFPLDHGGPKENGR